MISIIIPTFNEADNVKIIVPKISKILNDEDINGEIIIVDDNSPDGTANVAFELAKRYPVKVHVRYEDKGLSKAVIKGFELAEGDICVVMDADLSHPVERVPAMINPIIEDQCDVTVGSRNVTGGGFENFPLHRKVIRDCYEKNPKGWLLKVKSDPYIWPFGQSLLDLAGCYVDQKIGLY